MKLGSLFSGIGGLELGFQRTGAFTTVWQCEIDPYASAVLRERFPGVVNYGDITKVDWSKAERPDIIVGGFPCQDISVAGKGQGIKDGARSGLWREYARAIRELRPRYVVVENVAMLARRGLNIVLGDLAALGYDAEWFTLRASDVGAPHRRERLFIIAHSRDANGGERGEVGEVPQGENSYHNGSGFIPNADNPRPGLRRDEQLQKSAGDEGAAAHSDHDGASGQATAEERWRGMQTEPHDNADAADHSGERTLRQGEDRTLQKNRQEVFSHGLQTAEGAVPPRNDDSECSIDAADTASLVRREGRPSGQLCRFPEFKVFENIVSVKDLFNRPDIPEPLVRGVNDGLPRGLDGFARKERTKCLGNAVVPAVAEVVAGRVLEMEKKGAKK